MAGVMPAILGDVLGEHFGTAAVQTAGLAFPTLTGVPMRRSNFRKPWHRALMDLGWTDDHPLAGLVFHELRHTAVALAIAQSAHPLAIKERLGHSSITVTLDRYGGLFPSLDEAIAEGLDAVLREQFSAKREQLADSVQTKRAKIARLPRSERS